MQFENINSSSKSSEWKSTYKTKNCLVIREPLRFFFPPIPNGWSLKWNQLFFCTYQLRGEADNKTRWSVGWPKHFVIIWWFVLSFNNLRFITARNFKGFFFQDEFRTTLTTKVKVKEQKTTCLDPALHKLPLPPLTTFNASSSIGIGKSKKVHLMLRHWATTSESYKIYWTKQAL